jgi:hypothetical protein
VLVYRSTWLAKRGCRSQLLEIGRQEVEEMDAPHAVRTLIAGDYAGSSDTVIWEFEFEDIGELDAYWAHWAETREGPFFEKMDPLAERLSTEILRLVD